MTSPNIPQYQELCDLLEQQVDRYNLRDVLTALANVCDAKADHILSHYNDYYEF